MLIWLLLLTLVCLPSPALAVESFGFAVIGDGDGSPVVYAGDGGPLHAGDLTNPFSHGVGSAFSQLLFTTGPNLQEPTQIPGDRPYLWAGGGQFALLSFLDDDGHWAPNAPRTLLAGLVTGASMEIGALNPETASWATSGFDLELWIEEGPEDWIGRAATGHLGVGDHQFLILAGIAPFGFLSNPNTLTITLVPTPEPGTWLLMGSGLAAVGFVGRVRCRCCRGPVGIPHPSRLCAICRTPGESLDVCFCGKVLTG
jgi:hypothetical protein